TCCVVALSGRQQRGETHVGVPRQILLSWLGWCCRAFRVSGLGLEHAGGGWWDYYTCVTLCCLTFANEFNPSV
ncbi:hypothetical protein A2U01_0020395, partial [Trifolium medium]|nr:hypothetical protein [Trifolium medium]